MSAWQAKNLQCTPNKWEKSVNLDAPKVHSNLPVISDAKQNMTFNIPCNSGQLTYHKLYTVIDVEKKG